MPDAREAFRQALSPLAGFGLPARLMGFGERAAFFAVPPDNLRLAEVDLQRPPRRVPFGLPDEFLQPRGHAARDLGLDLIDRAERLRIAELGFLVLCLHAAVAGNGIDLAAIIDRDKAAPITFGEPEPALFQCLLERCAVI